MLTIRYEQFVALEHAVLEAWLEGHLNSQFPEFVAHLAEEGLSRFIRHGIERAAAHDLTAGSQVAHWINLMVLLGPDFDTAEAGLPWVTAILRRTEPASAKIRQLLAAAEREVLEAPPHE
jgi:hypothetical protein